MSEIYCISYSDFGYLLTEKDWSIKIQKLKDYDFEVYEDLLTADDITLKRRFLGSVHDLLKTVPILSLSLNFHTMLKDFS